MAESESFSSQPTTTTTTESSFLSFFIYLIQYIRIGFFSLISFRFFSSFFISLHRRRHMSRVNEEEEEEEAVDAKNECPMSMRRFNGWPRQKRRMCGVKK